jgi:apocytochrome f
MEQKHHKLVPAGLTLIVKKGDVVKTEQALNRDPNVGGFGQEESEIVLQNPFELLVTCFLFLCTY